MLCEMCGKRDATLQSFVEGASLSVCKECAPAGSVIRRSPIKARPQPIASKPLPIQYREETVAEVVEDCAELVKKGRERFGLSQEQLAHQLSERESLIHKVETGHTPPIALARKLERALKIKLVEEVGLKGGGSTVVAGEALTIGDIIKIKKH